MKKLTKAILGGLCAVVMVFGCGCSQIQSILDSLLATPVGGSESSVGDNTVDETIFEGNYKEISEEQMEEIGKKWVLLENEEATFFTQNEGVSISVSYISDREDREGAYYSELNYTGKMRYYKEKKSGECLLEAKQKGISNGSSNEETVTLYGNGNKVYQKSTLSGKEEKSVEETSVLEGMEDMCAFAIEVGGNVFRGDIGEQGEKYFMDDTDTKYTKVKITCTIEDPSGSDSTYKSSSKGEVIVVLTKDYKIVAYKGESESSSENKDLLTGETTTNTMKTSASIIPWSGTIQKPNDLDTYSAAE